VDARKLLSQLQEALKETFKEHSRNIQATFREHSGNIQGTLRWSDLRDHEKRFAPPVAIVGRLVHYLLHIRLRFALRE
jgi:hypothetical protein